MQTSPGKYSSTALSGNPIPKGNTASLLCTGFVKQQWCHDFAFYCCTSCVVIRKEEKAGGQRGARGTFSIIPSPCLLGLYMGSSWSHILAKCLSRWALSGERIVFCKGYSSPLGRGHPRCLAGHPAKLPFPSARSSHGTITAAADGPACSSTGLELQRPLTSLARLVMVGMVLAWFKQQTGISDLSNTSGVWWGAVLLYFLLTTEHFLC